MSQPRPLAPPAMAGHGRRTSEATFQRHGRELLDLIGVEPVRSAGRLAVALARVLPWSRGDRQVEIPLEHLIISASRLDHRSAAISGEGLIGRGPGLTPLGDDLLAATVLARWSISGRLGEKTGAVRSWSEALIPAAYRRRTTPASVYYLRRALIDRPVPALSAVLDPRATENSVRSPGQALVGVGHSTGRAYVAAIGTTYLMLGNKDESTMASGRRSQ